MHCRKIGFDYLCQLCVILCMSCILFFTGFAVICRYPCIQLAQCQCNIDPHTGCGFCSRKMLNAQNLIQNCSKNDM